ncbi:MAG: cell division protein FtsA [Chloroflexi bacterium]|nr:cell division protein FtsA [Chloroflexota bacterium]
MQGIVFALDIGSSKICALVGEVRNRDLQIIGYGVAPARGVSKGMIVDVMEAAVCISKAIAQAEQSSGYQLARVFMNVSGEHIQSQNNSGIAAISSGKQNLGVTGEDIARALDTAQAIAIPHNRQILHLLPRSYTIDGQTNVRSPLGMHGFRLEVEAHIITAATPALQNLTKCAQTVGIQVEEMVLNSLASAEAVLAQAEKDMGVLLVDIGAGTTDVALYNQGAATFTRTLPIGSSHISNDIAIGLRVPFDVAEEIKLKYGDCRPEQINPTATFSVEQFNDEKIQVGRQDLAFVIEARVEEIFQFVLQAVQDSGYTGLLPAGIVLTGGGAQLKGMPDVANKVLGIPGRVAAPRNLNGLVENINSPTFATSVGLLRWAISEHNVYKPGERPAEWGRRLTNFFRALLPG